MMKIYKTLYFFCIALIIISCKDDEPLPTPTVDFFTDPEVIEVGVPVMFENQTVNASNYEWDFGNGETSTEISPSATYSDAGTFTVKLTAFTKDGQSVEVTKDITVRERVVTGFSISAFPKLNGEEVWDPDKTGDETNPDVLVQFFADSDTQGERGLSVGTFFDIDDTPFGAQVDPQTNRVVLTNETWAFSLFDFDGEEGDPLTNDNVLFMFGVQFNPLDAVVVKNEDGDAGYISVLLSSGGQILDVDIFFRLE